MPALQRMEKRQGKSLKNPDPHRKVQIKKKGTPAATVKKQVSRSLRDALALPIQIPKLKRNKRSRKVVGTPGESGPL